MAEWLKAHAWKACIGETLSRVRIPVSPPFKINSLQLCLYQFCTKLACNPIYINHFREHPTGLWIERSCKLLPVCFDSDMKIEEAIKEALDGGLGNGRQVTERFPQLIWEKFGGEILLLPDFWQSLGKGRRRASLNRSSPESERVALCEYHGPVRGFVPVLYH